MPRKDCEISSKDEETTVAGTAEEDEEVVVSDTSQALSVSTHAYSLGGADANCDISTKEETTDFEKSERDDDEKLSDIPEDLPFSNYAHLLEITEEIGEIDITDVNLALGMSEELEEQFSDIPEELAVSNCTHSLRGAEGGNVHYACEEHQFEIHHEEHMCSCICTCEFFEEAHPLAAHLAPVCNCCNNGPHGAEFECVCDEGEHHAYQPVEPVYYFHCCSCGVEISPDDADHHHGHGNHGHGHPQGNNPQRPNLGADEQDAEQEQERNQGNPLPRNVPEVAVPAPPPPPPAVNENSRMVFRNTTLPPISRLRAVTCEDGSPYDTRLHEAARAGNLEKLKQLLKDEKLRRNINSKIRPFMATPLRDAVAGGSLECVRFILSMGAEVDALDIKGQTPLFLASSLGYPATMEELLKRGADPEGSSLNNCTPLLLCVRDGCLEGVQVLLEYGVNPEPVSLTTSCVPGWPLQHCIVYRHFKCFVALLRGGAQTSLVKVIQNRMGLDPDDQESLERGTMQRLSITRTVLRHASDMPEFLLAYREFGGTFEGFDHLAEDMKNTDCPALKALRYCYDNPSSLRSLCRMKIFRTVGAKRMPEAIASLPLPASLSQYLQYKDVYNLRV